MTTSPPAAPYAVHGAPTAGPATTEPDDTTVLGDGTTTRSRLGQRWRRWRWPLTVVLVVVLAAVLASLLTPRTTRVPLAPDNPEPDGARALAQVLTDQGVAVTTVRRTADAVRAATGGTTLLVTSTHLLDEGQVEALRGTSADLVLVRPDWWVLDALSDGALDTAWNGATGLREAACADPDAQAAGTVLATGQDLVAVDDRATVCFPGTDPAAGALGSAVVDDRRVVALADPAWLSNDGLDDHGHAALTLRLLGAHEDLVWYLPSLSDSGEDSAPGVGALTPDWTGPVAAQLAVVLALLALWRGRALGRVVTEPLPVTVRAAEAALGRGRLYRRSRSRGHAAAALRAGAAHRCATRVGLPRTADAPTVIDALARATGRGTAQVADLLYGPPPTDDAGLLELARRLDELESEVHRT